jgi:hypothetical protein
MTQDFTVVEVGKPYTMFNIGNLRGVDSGMVFEALPENSGYAINIYLSNLTELEAALISEAPISVRVLRDTPSLIMPTVRIGNSPLLFEVVFDPTLYPDKRAMQLVLDNNRIQIVGVDSNTNIVKALRLVSMPNRLREMLMSAWSKALDEEGFSTKFARWSADLASRYSLIDLWERSVYVGKLGER